MSEATGTMMDKLGRGTRLESPDEMVGLRVPEWTPRWSELPEEAHIPG